MVLENRLVRDLPEKSSIESTDFVVIEDLDGSKLGSVSSLRKLMMDNLVFENIEDMKMHTFNTGDYCITLGYYNAGDGGGAIYKIVYEPTAIDDKATWHYLYTSDTLRAKFVPFNGVVSPEQFGAYGNGSKNDYNAIEKCLNTGYKVVFGPAKTYRISRSIPLKNKSNIDLNGSTIKPANCKAFSTVEAQAKGIYIRNGYIDMSSATSYTVFDIAHITEDVTIENINVYGGYGKVVESNTAERLVLFNCKFQATSVKAIAIQIGKPDTGNVDYSQTLIDNVSFNNYLRAVSLTDANITMDVSVRDCSMVNIADAATTLFLHNTRTNAELYQRHISIIGIYTSNVDCIFDNQSNDIVSIKDVTLRNAKMLFKATSTRGAITIEGQILLNGDASANKVPIFYNAGGIIYLNTSNIIFTSDRYYEKVDSSGNFSAATLYDSMPINVYPEINKTIQSGKISVPFFRNGIINVTSAGNITGFSSGINNQIIGLRCNTGATISSGSNITLKGGTSKPLSNTTILYLKYNSNQSKWTEF